jgi:4-diphosphocytidyl-2-C-methyl-D-erythritol kinase
VTDDVKIAAHAKVNLRLRVLARETSGYHAIETIFLRLELADQVTIRVGGEGETLDVRGDDTGPAEQNLAVRAARAYREVARWPAGVSIAIDKRIPTGAGLGGGSADAGAVLVGLNRVAPQPLSMASLLLIAAKLGADVPFLTSGAPMAFAWGRGERMMSLPALPQRKVVILMPPFATPTADAYAALAAERWRDTSHVPEPALFDLESLRTWEGCSALATNDFEPGLVARHESIAAAIALLRNAGGSPAMLTGSGSAVFAVFSDSRAADHVQASLREQFPAWEAQGWRAIVTDTASSAKQRNDTTASG